MVDQNQERRRGHFHRGRRGPDRRGLERRLPPPAAEQPGRDQVDVEQIMRNIRARISPQDGLDVSNQQIEELAARRLEAILDPRAIKPALLDEMRKAAGAPAEPAAADHDAIPYTFDESSIYDSHRGLLRSLRRLLNPILRLFFNPTPILRALGSQAALNVKAATREAERERRQAEWNALQYEIVRRVVTEISRVSIELQTLSGRIESLSAKVDFNERRVRGIEGTVHQTRPPVRTAEVQPAAAAPPDMAPPPEPAVSEGGQQGDAARRRRRRRRGRRGGGPAEPGAAPQVESVVVAPSAAEATIASAVEPSDTPTHLPATTEGELLVRESRPLATEPAPSRDSDPTES